MSVVSAPGNIIVVDGVSLSVLTEDENSWADSSLLSVTQITSGGLDLLLKQSIDMRHLVRDGNGGDDRLKHRIVGTVFFEASTRTACSFQAAALRLGATFIHVDGQGNTSAGKKGESLTDTIQCLACYTDLTVLRHFQTGSVGQVVASATKPVINAGDGVGEHPTQALLDVFTIFDERDSKTSAANGLGGGVRTVPDSLTVVLLGDLKHGRTVHSLAKLLCVTQHILWDRCLTLRFCAPPGLELPEAVRAACASNKAVTLEQYTDPVQACCHEQQQADVLYVTRVQRERFDSDEAYQSVKVRGPFVAVG